MGVMVGNFTGGGPEAWIYVEEGDAVTRHRLGAAEARVGRGPENEIRLADPRIAKRHATIFAEGGRHFVRPAKRSVRVDGRLHAEATALSHGTRLDLESVPLTYVTAPTAPTVVLQLGITAAGRPPWFLLLDAPRVTLGRDGADVLLPDRHVGARHCLIEVVSQELAFLVPLELDADTLINGRPIDGARRLRDGDRLMIGASEIVVRLLPGRLPATDQLAVAIAPAAPTAAPRPASVAVPAAGAPPPPRAPTPPPLPSPPPVPVVRRSEPTEDFDARRHSWLDDDTSPGPDDERTLRPDELAAQGLAPPGMIAIPARLRQRDTPSLPMPVAAPPAPATPPAAPPAAKPPAPEPRAMIRRKGARELTPSEDLGAGVVRIKPKELDAKRRQGVQSAPTTVLDIPDDA